MSWRTAGMAADPKKRTMVPAIGVMIAAYIITRMLEMLSRDTTKTIIKVMGVITILITLVSVVDVLNSGLRASARLERLAAP